MPVDSDTVRRLAGLAGIHVPEGQILAVAEDVSLMLHQVSDLDTYAGHASEQVSRCEASPRRIDQPDAQADERPAPPLPAEADGAVAVPRVRGTR